jgi:hypothetical protein
MKQITLKWFWIKCFTYLSILVLLGSCTPDFQKPHYKKRFQISNKHVWKRRPVILFKTGIYRDPLIKPETRREMVKPKTINLDKW